MVSLLGAPHMILTLLKAVKGNLVPEIETPVRADYATAPVQPGCGQNRVAHALTICGAEVSAASPCRALDASWPDAALPTSTPPLGKLASPLAWPA